MWVGLVPLTILLTHNMRNHLITAFLLLAFVVVVLCVVMSGAVDEREYEYDNVTGEYSFTGSPSWNPSESPEYEPFVECECPVCPPPVVTVSPTTKPTAKKKKKKTKPTKRPTRRPTSKPSRSPTFVPTRLPSRDPTYVPTGLPTTDPTTHAPTTTKNPTSVAIPTAKPTPWTCPERGCDMYCNNGCGYAAFGGVGKCDDGGPGSVTSLCMFGHGKY